MNNKFLCVHGHFYQPPRENPWTGETEPEESAHPYRDWNARIFEECYGPNSSCPLPDARGLIAEMADNYREMSFNFGPTLLSWLEKHRPETYDRVLAADRDSAARRGHGNALAQPYIHAILPLATRRDKTTLVRWGIEDFRLRFGRDPEGMWLPETAVDEETLEVLIEEGILFTILSPTQALRVRTLGAGDSDWKKVTGETLLPTRPYRWESRLSPGRHLAVFFYHHALSQSVVSGEALISGDALYHKVTGRYLPDDSVQLVSLASDGEYYGHHHARGHVALAQALRLLKAEGVEVVNYAQFLERFPPPQEVDIRPNTAWSCDHGLGRWTADCGCRSPQHGNWRQAWRKPMREALDWLSGRLDEVYERKAGAYFKDYREARDAYAGRLLGPSPAAAEEFLGGRSRVPLTPQESAQALSLLELERHRLSMFTSCGWFFDDISGLESVLCLKSAARAVEIAKAFGEDVEPEFKARLFHAPSNLERFKNGVGVYESLVLSARAGLDRAAAHFALLSHIEGRAPGSGHGFEVLRRGRERREKLGLAGRDRAFSWERLRLRRLSTWETLEAVAAVHQKDGLDFACRVSEDPSLAETAEELCRFFEENDDAAFEAELSARFGPAHYTLDAMFSEGRLDALRRLMPGPGGNRERRQFLERWTAALARPAEGADDEVLGLLEECREQRLLPDQLPRVSELRERFQDVFRTLLEEASAESLSRAARWTLAFEKAGLAVSVWWLQDFFWRWRARLLAGGAAPAEREAAVALGEKLGFSDAALGGLLAARSTA